MESGAAFGVSVEGGGEGLEKKKGISTIGDGTKSIAKI